MFCECVHLLWSKKTFLKLQAQFVTSGFLH